MNTAALRERIGTEGVAELGSFTSEELVAVGADSPLEGLLISERLAAMGPVPLNAALGSALRSLVARGLIDSEAISGAPTISPGGELAPLPLRGDLALVVDLRRRPQLLALVSSPRPSELAALSLSTPPKIEIVLHGFSEPGNGPIFLEERRSLLGIHRFSLRDLEGQAASLVGWLAEQATVASARSSAFVEGQFVTVELRRPELDGSEDEAAANPRHLRLTIGPEPGHGSLRTEPEAFALEGSDTLVAEIPDESSVSLGLDELTASLVAALRSAWRDLALKTRALPAH